MKKFKLPLIIFSGLIVIIITLSLYAYNKLGPDEIRQIIVEKLQQEFPGAQASLGNLSLSFGLSAKVNLQNLELVRNKNKLLSIEKVSARIPFWSMLFGLGSIDIKLDSPQINYLEYKNTNNWKQAQGNTKKIKVSTTKDASSMAAPGFILKNVKINFQLINLLANYRFYKSYKGSVKVAQLKIDNFAFNGPSTFYLQTQLSFGKYSLNLENSGEIDLKKRELKCKLSIKDLKIQGLKLSKLENDIFLSWDQKGNLAGNLISDFKKAGNLKIDIRRGFKGLQLNNLGGKIDLFYLFKAKSGVDFKGSIIKFSGGMKIGPKSIDPNINIDWVKGPKITNGKLEINTSVMAKIRPSKLNITLGAKLLGGHITSNFSGRINYSNITKLDSQGPFKLDVILKNLKMDSKLFVTKKKSLKGTGAKRHSVEKDFNLPLIRGLTNIKWNNLSFGPEKLNGFAVINTRPSKLNLSKLKFTLGKAYGNLTLQVVANPKSLKTNIDFSVRSLNLKQFEFLFPPGINVVTGHLNSKLKGWIKEDKRGSFSDLNFNLDVRNGEIKDFNLEKHLRKIFTMTPFLTRLNNKNVGSWVTGDFEKLSVVGSKKNDYLNLSNFHMIGIKKKIEIKGKGRLAEGKKSEVYLDFFDHKKVISGGIEKYTGDRSIPLKFEGTGFKLKPQYEYSVETLVKRSINYQADKATKKLRKGLDKKLKNLFKF